MIGLGGGIGSIARYLTSVYVTRLIESAFPYGTLAVNILGSMIIGLIFGFSDRYSWLTPELRLLLATGFCGGFTTFSTFSYETLTLLRQGYLYLGVSNILLNVVACIAATLLGLFLVRII